jgi:HPt (histidine-containing phosphotransfer) domain-containing protein
MFIKSMDEPLMHLRDAVDSGNYDDIHRMAHTIKGSAANIGASRIMAVAATLDDMVKSGDVRDVARQLQLLETEFDSFKRVVHDAALVPPA